MDTAILPRLSGERGQAMSDLDKLIAMADKVYKDIFNVARRERGLIRGLADALVSVRAERDAAVVAIERVRAAVEKHKHWNEDCGWDVPTIEVLAALDGAPEPEWEYGLLNPQAPDGGKLQGGAHLISDSRDHIITQQRSGHPVIQAVRRRKAGPWLPVEEHDG